MFVAGERVENQSQTIPIIQFSSAFLMKMPSMFSFFKIIAHVMTLISVG